MSRASFSLRQAGRRSLVETGVAAFCAALLLAGSREGGWLAPLLPLPSGDPFHSTLAILPLVVAGLRAVERWGRALRAWPETPSSPGSPHPPTPSSGGRGAGGEDFPSAGRLEALFLGILVLLTLSRHSFGLAATDWFLVAGYLLLLTRRVGRLVVGLRPCLEGARRPPLVFLLLPCVVYLAIQPWMAEHRQPDGDEPYYLLITHSLLHDTDAELSNNYANRGWQHFMERPIEPQPGDPQTADGGVVSRHSPLLPLVLLPSYAVAGRWGAMATMAFLTSLLAWMVLRLARRASSWHTPVSAGGALLAWAVVAFSPPLLLYSYQIWVEVPGALLICVVLDRLAARRESPKDGWSRRDVAVIAAALVLLPLLKLRFVLLAASLACLVLWRARMPRQALVGLVGGVFVAVLGVFLFNQLRYGTPFKIYSLREVLWLDGSPVLGLLGLLFDSAFGLAAAAPLWVLVIPAAWLLVRRREPLLAEALLVCGPYLAALVPRVEWYGGWAPPFRYGLVTLPFLALALAPLLETRWRPGLRALLAGLGLLSLALTLIWVAIPGWTYNFADGRTHLLDGAGARFGLDVARLFPSMVRPRAATWIWPLAALLLIPIASLGSRRARRASTPATLGAAALLLGLAIVPSLASTLPTRLAHVEDAWVRKDRGQVIPELWVTQRPRYRAGWVVPPEAEIQIPVIPAAERVTLRLSALVVIGERPYRLRIFAGGKRLGLWAVEPGDWRETEIGPIDWPAGEPLVIRGPRGQRKVRAAVDKVEFLWAKDGG